MIHRKTAKYTKIAIGKPELFYHDAARKYPYWEADVYLDGVKNGTVQCDSNYEMSGGYPYEDLTVEQEKALWEMMKNAVD